MSDANYDYIANAGGPRPNTISNVGGISPPPPPPPPPPPAPSWVPRAPSGNVATVFIGFASDQYWAAGATQTIAMLEGNTTVGDDWTPGNLIVSGKGFPLGNIGSDSQGAIIAGNLAGDLPATGYTAVITTLEGNVTSINQTVFLGIINSDFSQYCAGSATISVGNLTGFGDQDPPGTGTATVSVSLTNPSKAAFLEIGNQTNAVSLNGGGVTTGNTGVVTADAFAVGIDGGSGNVAYVGNIAIWGPEPEADLPALSTP